MSIQRRPGMQYIGKVPTGTLVTPELIDKLLTAVAWTPPLADYRKGQIVRAPDGTLLKCSAPAKRKTRRKTRR